MEIRHLSTLDAITLLEIIHSSVTCSAEQELIALMARLGELLPYQASLACLSTLKHGTPTGFQVVNVDYPEEYLSVLGASGLIAHDPIVAENFKTYRLQYWADTFRQQAPTPQTHQIISLAEDYGFSKTSHGVGYGHGALARRGNLASFFCYHGLERSRRTEEILTLLIPHFHEALCRTSGTATQHPPDITPREREILQWLAQGKSTWDISVILNISERTVKFHVGNLLQKLNASTRAHAVAIALENGLVDSL